MQTDIAQGLVPLKNSGYHKRRKEIIGTKRGIEKKKWELCMKTKKIYLKKCKTRKSNWTSFII